MVRFYGHFEGDAQTYRAKGEVEDLRAHRDCIRTFSKRVIEASALSLSEIEAVDSEVRSLIEDAVASAKTAPLPGARDLLTDVYVSY
jgi:pyruvate dehydrogenase E1 component alpha subunit